MRKEERNSKKWHRNYKGQENGEGKLKCDNSFKIFEYFNSF